MLQLDNGWEKWLEKWFLPLVVFGVLVNLTGLFVTILDSDGSLYASIAKTMFQTGDFVRLYVEGKDWLDKPHFPFWLAALSYRFFGVSTFAYKLPALLFWAMGAVYTHRFALRNHGSVVAKLSVLMYLVAAHLFVSNNDVRAEPYLTGLTIAAVYHLQRAEKNERYWGHIVLAAFFTGCALMTKGLFVLFPIVGGIAIDWMLKKDWQRFLQPKWWIALLMSALFTLPELFCLYVQFDLHPEKIVFGHDHVSGIRFFFWDSQFGRFFNNGPIQGEGDPLFYLHTLLWAFLPWGILWYLAVAWKTWNIRSAACCEEYVSFGAGGLMFLVFSLSKFQLPHYLNIVFPFFCVLSAQFVVKGTFVPTRAKITGLSFWATLLGMTAVAVALVYFYRPEAMAFSISLIAIAVGIEFFLFNRSGLVGMFGKAFLTSSVLYLFLNLCFYPSVMQYQSGSEAAFYANRYFGPSVPVAIYGPQRYSFVFYTNAPMIDGGPSVIEKAANKKNIAVYTDKEGLDKLNALRLVRSAPRPFPFFHASELSTEFLDRSTRQQELATHYLVLIGPSDLEKAK